MDVAEPDVGSELIDLSSVSLAQVQSLEGTVLAHSLRRIIDAQRRSSKDDIAAFNSAPSPAQ
jgi:FXSXX-COOH protein